MKCLRPGCSGEIEDGYCNVCGLAPAVAVPRSAVVNPSSAVANPRSASIPTGTSGTGGSGRSGRGGSTGTRASRRTGTTRRGQLGAGLVEVPPVPYRDPASVVLADPQVPEGKRFCANCGEAVGRRRGDRPGRQDGFCPRCGRQFSFSPKLGPADVVGGQYVVVGCLAHGGLGWIYLARDRNVSDRWVVLKGLLDAGDDSAMAAAIAERRFLAQVEHPNIVRIYNFVEHDGAGYIVMEYVGGQSLKDLRAQQRDATGAPSALPLDRAIAYVLEILPALGYLHSRDLLFCDFKPDNVIQTEEQLKLIDLGGVRLVDDDTSGLYGTVGYQAPEVPDTGATVASDLYTVGRTLAVLSFDFRGFQDPKRYATSLPPAADVPLFSRYDAFYRWLCRATHPQPEARFPSAGDMAEQLLGVLHQVVAIDSGRSRPVVSQLFTPELRDDQDLASWQSLPVPAIDPTDPAAGLLAGLAAASPAQAAAALGQAPPSPDVIFQRAHAELQLGRVDEAIGVIEQQAKADRADWRGRWWGAVAQLAAQRPSVARELFDRVHSEIPGELAPLLGIAIAAETAGDDAAAGWAYGLVSLTDRNSNAAHFGLARVCRRAGDRHGAAAALGRVSPSSTANAAGHLMLARVLSEPSPSGPPSLSDLSAASAALNGLDADPVRVTDARRHVLVAALSALENGAAPDARMHIGEAPFDQTGIRSALEQACRTLARLAGDRAQRIALVDQANAVRPRTLR